MFGAGPSFPNNFAAQLSSFIDVNSGALSDATHLTLSLSLSNDGNCEDANMLIRLFDACRLIERLTINGLIDVCVLQFAGVFCFNLVWLEAYFKHLPISTVESITTLLPHLTSLTELSLVPPSYVAPHLTNKEVLARDPFERALYAALLGANCLLHLDLGLMPLTQNIWKALPDGLRSLRCLCSSAGPYSLKYYLRKKFTHYPASLTYSGPPGAWEKRPSLQSIELTGSCVEDGVALLDGLLWASPNVCSLHLRDTNVIDLPLSLSYLRYLQSLDRHMDHKLDRPQDQGMYPRARMEHKQVSITGQESSTGPHNTSESKITVLLRIPRSAAENAMSVCMAAMVDKPLCNFSKVSFWKEGNTQMADMAHLPIVFPNLVDLCVTNMVLQMQHVRPLVGCGRLQRLELLNVHEFSQHELELLCAQQQSLRCVVLKNCRGVVQFGGAPMVGFRKIGNVSVSINNARS